MNFNRADLGGNWVDGNNSWRLGDGLPELVSVIVPVHERRSLVVDALDSVAAQTYRPIELIVVDDGSSDDTPQVVEDWIRAVGTNTIDRCELVRQENAGAAAARNTGVLRSRGALIQFLDSDDVLTRDKIFGQVELLRKTPNAAFAYCEVRQLENPTRVIYGQSSLDARAMTMRQLQVPVTQTAAPLIRRIWLERIGPMCVDLSPFDDWEYFSRATSMGLEGVRCNLGAVLWRTDDVGPRLSRPRGKPKDWSLKQRRLRQLISMYKHACPTLAEDPRFLMALRWQVFLVLCGSRYKGTLRPCVDVIEPLVSTARVHQENFLDRHISAAANGGLSIFVAWGVLATDWLYWRWKGVAMMARRIMLWR